MLRNIERTAEHIASNSFRRLRDAIFRPHVRKLQQYKRQKHLSPDDYRRMAFRIPGVVRTTSNPFEPDI